jgi:hypothetical protein
MGDNNHGDYLFRFARKRVQKRAIAEDEVHHTALEALKGFETFLGDASERKSNDPGGVDQSRAPGKEMLLNRIPCPVRSNGS